MGYNEKPNVPQPKTAKPANIMGPSRVTDVTSPVIKGIHYHLYNNTRYDVDTPYKELYWEEIKKVQDRAKHRVWRYGSDYGCLCPSCSRNSDLVFNIQRLGVYMKCTYCGVTIPAPPVEIFDLGSPVDDLAELVIDEEITVEEAEKIMARTGQVSPFPIMRKRRRRTSE